MGRWLVVVLCLLFTGCKREEKKKTTGVPVTAVRVEAKTVPADFEYVGVAESSHIVQIRARVEGYLESIHYKEGGTVHEGDLLFVLDQRPFLAALESAQGALERQKAVLWNAEQTKSRMVPLYQQNAVSQRDLDNALAEELSAKADVQIAEGKLATAKLNLSFASITAPVKGLASRAKYREGALITPGEENLLTTLYVVDPIWINFNVSSNELLLMRKEIAKKQLQWPDKKQFQVEAILSDGTILPAEGYIDFTDPAVQQSTGTFLIRAVLPNPKLRLYPGQFVKVVVKGATRPHAILVPQTSVVQGQKGTFVYVIEEGRAVQRSVVPGSWYKDYWVIDEGLKSGEIVIAQGVNKVQSGTPVLIRSLVSSGPS